MNYENQMKKLPKDQQPYEKSMELGITSLTDVELLAIIIRNGVKGRSALDVARSILEKKPDGLLGMLKLELEDLICVDGIGRVKALQILSVMEFARRIAKRSAGEKLDFSSPGTVAGYYMEDMRHLKQEHLVLVMLNGKNKFIRDRVLFIGSVNQSIVNPREIFIEALKNEAVNIILLHNHPSGDITPSRADLLITHRVKEAGSLIGINLLDHIIIGDRRYHSICTED